MAIHLSHLEAELPDKPRLRGYDYYCEGRVKSVFNINGIEWMAVVQGYDDHVVQLRIEQDSVLSWSCDCSDEDDPCKHVIAVLYFIRRDAKTLKINDSTGYEAIKEQLSFLPPHVLRYLILKYAAENGSFRKFLRQYLNA